MQYILILLIPATLISPRSTPIYLLTQLHVLFFFNLLSLICVTQILLEVSPFPGSWLIYRSHALKENGLSFSQQLPIANSSSARGRALCQSLSSMLEFFWLELLHVLDMCHNCWELICATALCS